MSRRARGKNPCRERTKRPKWALAGKEGNLRCDLVNRHDGSHEAGFTFEGKKYVKIWPSRFVTCVILMPSVKDGMSDSERCGSDLPCKRHGNKSIGA
jgi:hypothetical protein